jgi:potassium uptake TrkH family protein
VNSSSFFNRKRNILHLERNIGHLTFFFALLGFIAVFIDVGGVHSELHSYFDLFYRFCLTSFLLLFVFRAYLSRFVVHKKREKWLIILELVFLLVLLLAQFDIEFLEDASSRDFLQMAISVIFVVEISKRSLFLEKLKVNPPLIFIFSFLILILIGAFSLMLPLSTYKGIGFIDALFTSTSAVCVTGLTVVDTGTYFTQFGQNVLLVLISLGGLGVMTFTSFFGLFFKGETSFRNQMIYKDFMGEGNLRNVFSTIIKIVSLTIGVELVGGVLLFTSLNAADFPGGVGERIYFSFFHAISAFNNAGFQLKANGLYDDVLRHNYFFQVVIALLIIFGGLGFYIAFNIVSYIRDRLRVRVRHVLLMEPYEHKPWILNFNTKLVLRTTAILLVAGTVIFYLTEYNYSLKEHEGIGKWIVASFCSVTPRTAGFNNIDIAALSREGIMITILLMWIGASPGSTGGGIKTSTIAVATLGIFNIARGRDHIELARREIAKESLLRAFIIICLSLIVLGMSIMAVVIFNPDLPFEKITFECFSAFGTVGLSLNTTSMLSQASKIVIILTMFIGRVGTFTILVGILKKAADTRLYRYPVENVIIT